MICLASIAFETNALVLLFSALSLVITAYLSLMAMRRSHFRRMIVGLESLRVLIVLLVLAALNQPEQLQQFVPEEKPTIAVLWDDSASMETKDVPSGNADGTMLSRRESIADLTSSEPWKAYSDKFKVVVEPFSSSDDGTSNGTNISQALEDTANKHKNLLAAVLISDGIWNRGKPPTDVAAVYRLDKAPIYTLCVGSKVALPDLEVVSLDAPTFAVVGKPTRIPYTIRSTLPHPITIQAVLSSEDGQELVTEIELPAGGIINEAFQWKPKKIGDFTLSLRLPTVEGEVSESNNVMSATISVRQESLRVLVVDTYPRWEYRFLRNALQRDPGVSLSCVLTHPNLSSRSEGKDYLPQLPNTVDELSKYDVIFLGDIGQGDGQLTSADCERLKAVVRNHAVGLVFMPGNRGNHLTLADSELSDLLPVVFDPAHMMIHVCSAFQHAHQRGIIHRDIKPSNVLVAHGDSGPVPKIIDFGIAKVINDSMGRSDHFTLHGEMVGTPEYMSPEQALSSAEGVDTRTDVYSLGVLLYELLTGETPLAGVDSGVGLIRLRQLFRDSRMEMPSQRVARRRATNVSHEHPHFADEGKPERFLQGDVDCIVMKALAREPNDRYQSVSELKRDLERFVAGMPIEAAAPSFLYQLKKLINRHRVIASVASTACLFVIVASAIAIWFGLVANDRLRDVLAMQSELQIERDRAVDAERKARLLAQSYLAPAVLDQSIRRFCIEHWDQLIEVNPKLKSLPIPKENEPLHTDIQITIFDSNLIEPDERLIVLGESKWLVKILSEISKKDIGPLLMVAPQAYTIGEAVPVDSLAPTPVGESNSVPAQPVPADAASAIDTTFFAEREVTHTFPIAAKKAYLSIFCEELRAIDPQLPVVADAEDSLGLCLMDMQRPDLAIARFRESILIRESYPELHAQTLQAQLFTADCLKRLGKHAESKLAVDKVRSELTANTQTLDASIADHLNKIADAIEAAKASQ